MANIPEPMTLIGLGVLVVSNVGLWIDKVYQGKRAVTISGKNGTSLGGLHEKIDSIAASVATINMNTALVAAEMKGMKNLCKETRDRYERRFEKIEDNEGG